MSTLKPLGNTVMFEFLDDASGRQGRFTNTTASGIIVRLGDANQKANRWGRVLFVGPKVDGIVPGDFVLIEAMMWMEGTVVDGKKMWKTDDSKVIAVTNDQAECVIQ